MLLYFTRCWSKFNLKFFQKPIDKSFYPFSGEVNHAGKGRKSLSFFYGIFRRYTSKQFITFLLIFLYFYANIKVQKERRKTNETWCMRCSHHNLCSLQTIWHYHLELVDLFSALYRWYDSLNGHCSYYRFVRLIKEREHKTNEGLGNKTFIRRQTSK